MIDYKYGYVDKSGKRSISLLYDFGGGFCEGLAAVKLNGRYGYINHAGVEVIPFQFEEAGSFSEGLAPAQVNQKWDSSIRLAH
jgi:hypothetical protein